MAVLTRTLVRSRSSSLVPPKMRITILCAALVSVELATDFRQPQLDVEVDEQRVGLIELTAVKGTGRFTDDDRCEAPPGVPEGPEERSGFGAARQRQAARLADVVERADDLPPGRQD